MTGLRREGQRHFQTRCPKKKGHNREKNGKE
jgi:hypothetical protein